MPTAAIALARPARGGFSSFGTCNNVRVFEIGASLTAARQARGLELRDAERLTCMRTKYLVALEEDRFDQLPGRTYARTFLRTYAAALDLDADLFVAEFDEQHPEPDPGPQPAPRRVSLGRLPLSAAATVAAAALVAVIAAWSEWSAQRPAQPAAASAAAPPAAPVSTPRVAPKHVAAERKTVTRPSALVVRAVGGPCWILARRDGPTGSVLAERTLQQGQTARFDVTRVWLRLGAPWNVVVQRGSHRVRGLPAGVPANVIA